MPFFIFADTNEKYKGHADESKDFWTRVEPFIHAPFMLPKNCKNNCSTCYRSGFLKNLFLSFWIRCFEQEYSADKIRNKELGSVYIQMVQKQLEKYVGKVSTKGDNSTFEYKIGCYLTDKNNGLDEMLKKVCKDKKALESPRAFGNKVGQEFSKSAKKR